MSRFILLSGCAALLLAMVSVPLLSSTNYFSSLRLLPSWFSSEFADLVVTNAFIYTSDPTLPFVDSMAVQDGRILRIGNYSAIQDLAGSGTQKINLEGKVVVPGLIDSHVHLLYGGLQLVQLELRGVNGKNEFVRRVEEAVRNKKHGSWLLGGGWNNDFWGGELPEASWIDDITPQNPVWLSRMDGHMGLANSLALRVAGIAGHTEDPDGGMIMRNTKGEPTGLLVDSAMKLILPWIPEPSVKERREALSKASTHALMRGVTTVVDMGRYLPATSTQLSWDDFSGHSLSQWIYLGGVKAFADGSLGSSSALFYHPYIGEPNNYGLQVTDLDSLFNMTLAADKSGLQVATHAIGDKANDLILGLYKSVISFNGGMDRRFRIEHAQHLAPGTPSRFGEQGMIASMQPEHLLDDADSAVRKLGTDRAQNESYLFQSLLANNAQLAFGSDWPVADINPLGGIRAAMKRIPPGWKASWISSECTSLEEALNAYTISAARACFLDHHLGSLSPGKLADFVVLSTDDWAEFSAEGSASVEATYVGGKRAYP